jgi:hypothetical protein
VLRRGQNRPRRHPPPSRRDPGGREGRNCGGSPFRSSGRILSSGSDPTTFAGSTDPSPATPSGTRASSRTTSTSSSSRPWASRAFSPSVSRREGALRASAVRERRSFALEASTLAASLVGFLVHGLFDYLLAFTDLPRGLHSPGRLLAVIAERLPREPQDPRHSAPGDGDVVITLPTSTPEASPSEAELDLLTREETAAIPRASRSSRESSQSGRQGFKGSASRP